MALARLAGRATGAPGACRVWRAALARHSAAAGACKAARRLGHPVRVHCPTEVTGCARMQVPAANVDTRYFLGHGTADPLIPCFLSDTSKSVLLNKGAHARDSTTHRL